MCGVQINETSLWVKIRSFVSCVSVSVSVSVSVWSYVVDTTPGFYTTGGVRI